ncbi:hypothetical protein EZV62_006216 [Acer yangbiense]|uniref:F-box domain-containing protein n=1 Tax=Acer yangbiense TaxID=1000413 RepID=A0A5C7IPR4_9ROSI|nr:hypothetical protein EZV62_006216 [Acer yangbiense]
MSDIPPPIIVDILLRLPMKSLCRFRCVSKPWLALINHPRFAKMHLSRTNKQRLILQKDDLLYSIQLETLSCLRNSIPVEIELPAGMELDRNYTCPVIGSCKGLLCIRDVIALNGFLLYNPCTKECKTIPDLVRDEMFGFGYAESIDDYKIVKIPFNENGVFKLYSLRKDSWISIRSDFDFNFCFYTYSMVSFNGAIHFVTYYHQRPSMIAAFDLLEDKFKTLPPPPDFMLDKFKLSIKIGHLGGCLCLSIRTDSTSIELWVMKEYGVSGSWTKILRTKSVDMRPLFPLCYLNNNETILVRRGITKLMFWDSEDEEFKVVEIGCIQDEWSVENVYLESLVSLNRINGFTNEDDEGLLEYWCVSKPWLALINDYRFAKMHLSRTHKQRLILQKSNLLYSVQLETLSCLRNSIPVEIELPAGICCHVIGSCDGLLCIRFVTAASKGFLLYNLSTKECKTIPNMIQEDRDKLIGFGYAESIDDYKIVKIPMNENGIFSVYSLRKDSWISIPSDFDFDFYNCSSSLVSFNGAIHFVTNYLQRPSKIAAFDLVEDKFKTIPPPPDLMLDRFTPSIKIGHLGGCLCLSI